MLTYVIGDATKPPGYGTKVIAHVVNNRGGWGRGFVMALSRRWRAPERDYRAWYQAQDGTFILGRVQLVRVEPHTYVANMIAQDGYRDADNQVPLRYYALEECLKELALQAQVLRATVHMPRIGSGLAGGDWNKVEQLISTTLKDIDVFVYDLTP